MAIPPTLDTLAELIAEIPDKLAPSRGIPDRVKENLPEELYRILDYFRSRRLSRPVYDLHDLMDPESAPRDALEMMHREYDLPIWNDATDAQLRQIVRDIQTIIGLRNTVQGWQQFLTDISPSGVTITISKSGGKGRLFRFSRFRYGYPDQTAIDSTETTYESTRYLWNPDLFEITLTVTVTGTTTAAFREFLEETPRYFVPLYIGDYVTVNFNYV
jgi:hypothetical protein